MTATAQLICGDVRDVLATLDDNSVDAIVCDPPYGLHFMGKSWDQFGGPIGRDHKTTRERSGSMNAGLYDHRRNIDFQMWCCEWGADLLRVVKPGGHLLAFGSPRTYHRLTCGLEDAGWEIRDCLMWIFGSGFPKSLNLDGEWDGWGTSLKPGYEPIVLARKPLSEPTVAANVARWGTGALNIDGCRIGTTPRTTHADGNRRGVPIHGGGTQVGVIESGSSGRWPANVLLSHHPDCEPCGVKRVRGSDPRRANGTVNGSWGTNGVYGGAASDGMDKPRYVDADGYETVEAWRCVEGCPVAELDAQSGESRSTDRPRHNSGGVLKYGGTNARPSHDTFTKTTNGFSDTGGASRYFFTVPKEHVCLTCASPYAPKHGTMTATQEVASCDSASIAASSSPQNIAAGGSVPARAQVPLQHDSEDSSLNASGHASTAGSRSCSTSPTLTPTAPASALDSLTESLAPRVRSAASLCDSCVTAIARSLAAVLLNHVQISLRGQGCMPDYNASILTHNLASFAEPLVNTGIIPTTASLSILFGSVAHAISESTTTANEPSTSVFAPTRFIYQAKASTAERNNGLPHGVRSTHPTVKPLGLMQFLVRLVTPPGGTVLDPFAGSGSTLIAALREGFSAIGIDVDADYCELARRRIIGDSPLFNKVEVT